MGPEDRVKAATDALAEALERLCRERPYAEALSVLAQGLLLWRLKVPQREPADLQFLGGPFSTPAWRGKAPAGLPELVHSLDRVAPSPEELGLALETLHWERGKETSKGRGAFYTPPQLARFMARLALNIYLFRLARPRSRGREPGAPVCLPDTLRLYDPSVGVGAFLAAALAELAALPPDLTGGRTSLDFLRYLAGRDRDPEAVYLTRVRLWLQVAGEVAKSGRLFPPLTDIVVGHSLLDEPEPADIILENPPYLRQESLSREEKDALAARFGKVLPRQADLYAYFLANLKRELRPEGVAVLVTPEAWLEVDYGRALQEDLLKDFEIPLIVTSACERWFAQAAVHTAVSVFVRRPERGRRPCRPTVFVQLKQPLRTAVPALFAQGGRFSPGFSESGVLQAVRVSRTELKALTQRQGQVRARWGTLLRAPAPYFTLQAATCGAWISTGEIAQVTRGFTSGANAFFFVRDVTARVEPALLKQLGVEPGNGLRVIAARGAREERCFVVEERFLFPLVKSPREVAGYVVAQEELEWRVLLLPPDDGYVQGLRVASYIQWGEEQGFGRRSTTRSRSCWWSLPKLLPPQILARQFYDQRFNFPYNPGAALCDHTFYYLTGCAEPELLAALLNSTLTYFHVELWGRSNMGDGVLTFYGPELTDLPLPRPELFAGERGEELRRAFRRLAARPVLPIEREVDMADRRELDLVIMAGLGLTGLPAASLLAEIYTALNRLVAQRQERSRNGVGCELQ